MGLEIRYTLGKVLGIQDCLTLRLASHHCVLHPNLIKNKFNTCIYTLTHTSIHLSIQHGIFIPKQHTYQPKAREPNTKETLSCIKQGNHPSTATNIARKTYYRQGDTHMSKEDLNKQHACSCACMTYLTYLVASQHLWHHEWACECMFMTSRQETNIKP